MLSGPFLGDGIQGILNTTSRVLLHREALVVDDEAVAPEDKPVLVRVDVVLEHQFEVQPYRDLDTL